MEYYIENILSLFDGMSCGQLALNREQFKYKNYFASEVDEYAMKVTQANYPNTIQIGDVTKIKSNDLPKIDLLLGGSPCQNFSFAGKMNGMSTVDNKEILTLESYIELKEQGFEFQGESYLFWEYVRILKEVKPKYFLFENVMMIEKWEKVITSILGVDCIKINSSLLSAQNRPRTYWTNIPNVSIPKDRNIVLKDIMDFEFQNRVFVDKTKIKSYAKKKSYLQYDLSGKGYKSQDQRAFYLTSKHGALTSKFGYSKVKVLLENGDIVHLTPMECERLQTVPDNYTNYVSLNQRHRMLGNGWTIDIIAFILSFIKNDETFI